MVRRRVCVGAAGCLDSRMRSSIHLHRLYAQVESKQLDAKSGSGIAEDVRYRLRLLVREALDGNNIAALSEETATYLYGARVVMLP